MENLTESGATTDSVSASWTAPDGVYDGFNVICPNGSYTTTPTNEADTRNVTCTDLPTCAAYYNITVATMSGGKRSEPCQITITACR